MQDHKPADQTAIRTDLGAIFVSLELSRSTWLVYLPVAGRREKMSKHSIPGGDPSRLLTLFGRLKERARKWASQDFPLIVIQAAGLDGSWIHRALEREGIESWVVDADIASTPAGQGRRLMAKRRFAPSWRTSAANRGSVDGAGTDAGGRIPLPDLTRAQNLDRRACRARQLPGALGPQQHGPTGTSTQPSWRARLNMRRLTRLRYCPTSIRTSSRIQSGIPRFKSETFA